jgi:hypothetical protein
LIPTCFFLSLLLGSRCLLLAFYEKKRFFHLIFSLFYFLVASLVFVSGRISFLDELQKKSLFFLFLTLLVALLLIPRLRAKPKKKRLLLKASAFFAFVLFSTMSLGLALITHCQNDKPLLKVTLTGKTKEEWVEWKNPASKLQKQKVTAYQIELYSAEGKYLGEFFAYGELIALRAKVLRFSSLPHFFGVDNLAQIDALYNGYRSVSRSNQMPHFATSIGSIFPLTSLWEPLWEKIYHNTSLSRWIKAATLESTYFPLTLENGDPFFGSFYLTITEGGLSALSSTY